MVHHTFWIKKKLSSLKVQTFWNVTLCWWIDSSKRFKRS